MRPRPIGALLAVFVSTLFLATGCGSKGEEDVTSAMCGTAVCGDRQVCDRAASPPRCRCRPEYTGADCATCARGHTQAMGGACVPNPIDCRLNPAACGARGSCLMGQGVAPDLCVCQAGYTGHACQSCADGFQDNDNNGTCLPACKSTVCQGAQECSDASGTARCACPGNRTGPNCDMCPAGWVLRQADNTCVQTCAASGAGCGARRTCDAAAGVCVCQAGYTGAACDTCAEGFQDNDRNGSCTPSCAMTTCPGAQLCSDTMGTARCACPGNKTGANCDQCPTGWVVRPSDGACVQTCTSVGPTCGARRTCDDSSGTPTCVCQPGFAGDTCTACAAGYTSDGAGQCVRSAPPGTTLLGAGRFQGADYLLAIDPVAGTATALRPVPGLGSLRFTTDPQSKAIYTSNGSAIHRLDPTTGRSTLVATATSTSGLAFLGGALYTVGTLSPFLLKRIDLATAGVADVGPTQVSAVQAMAVDPAGALLVATPPVAPRNNGAELLRVDAATGMTQKAGALEVEGERLRPGDPRSALAFDATGKLFMVLRLGRTPEQLLADYCRRLASGLGYAGYDRAPLTSVTIEYNGVGPGATRPLGARGTMGKEIVAYLSYGRRTAAKGTLRVETTNPEAFLCVSTYEEVLELHLPVAEARFAGIGLSGHQPTFSLVVDGSVPPVTAPSLHVHPNRGTAAPAFSAYQLSKVYTAAEWQQRGLTPTVSAWDTDTTAPALLVEVDPTTLVLKRSIGLPGVELFPLLAPFTP